MIIDRDKHNKYVVGWKPNYTVPTNQDSSSGTNVTIVYGGGGSGSSTPVSSEAFSYYKVSDGENAITQEAKVQKDIANLSIIGDEGIKVELITDPTIFEASFTSTGTNTGVYKISYGKVTTVVEKPETQAEEPTEPEVVVTFPMTITYVSGEKIKAEQFDTLRLLNNTEEVATYPSSGLAIEGDADGILSISLEVYKEVQSVDEEGKPVQDAEGNPVMEKQGLYFNRILLTSQLEDQPSTQAEGDSTEEEPQQPTYESLLSFDVVVNIDTVIKLSSDSGAGLWKLDDNGNIYTEYNAYSLKELSAYGPGKGEAGEGAGFLHELGDVSIPDPNAIPDNAILQYNIETGKWEAVELELPEDSATREWVEQKFKDLINGAPADLDTLGEIAIAIQELQQLLDWFSFVDGRIRANYNLWGVGEVSAYGPASGSDPGTGGGAGYLHELDDVTINNDTLTDGQIIVWDEDSQMWVNTDFPGLDEDALALYLTQNKYATQEWVKGQLDPINNKLEEFQTTIDMINDMFEWDNGRIKAKATLYSVGEISAYGAGEGSSGTGGYLHELDDVLLTSLQDDQLLMYDATIEKWVNVDKDEVGLNETQLAQYLTEHNYAIMSNVVPITRRIIAGDGLQGGGPLSSDVTLSMAPLTASDIPGLDWSKIISGKPTTLAGYGITDGVNVVSVTGTGNAVTTASISGHTLTLTKALSFALITGTNATGTWPISITGNAATANKWTTARTITLAGSVIGSTSIDGSGNVTITTTYTTDNISALDGRYVNVTGDTMTGNLILPTLQANTSIILGSVKLEYDSASNALKISNVNTQKVINLYATGEISAYGYNAGSAGGGASALDDLDDVTLSNLQNGQALVYNSSTGQWVNTTIQAGGIDETALAQYLTNNQYLTMPTGDGRYVKKAGDTMTGALTIDLNSTYPLYLRGTTAYTVIKFNDRNNASKADIGWLNDNRGNLVYLYNQDANSMVSVSTDGLWFTDTSSTAKKYKVWHAGNDGSGSGLDADLLDGLHYSSFESYRVVQINASSLNQNTWYPVTMAIGNSQQTRIRIEGNTSANASWNPRADKYMALILDYTVNGSSWGWTDARRVIYQYMEGAGTSSCLRGLGQLTNSSTEYVFVRGGAVYKFYVSRFITPVLRTSTYTVSEQSVSPTTTAPAAISRTNALITDNVYSATQLQTARTINGTAFNGTSNIVTSYWGTARTLSLTGNATGSVSMNGSSNVSMSVNVNYATSAGNADTLDGVHNGNVTAIRLDGVYTGGGGMQQPSYFAGRGKGIFLNMMNQPAQYSDVIYIDAYGGRDVPYVNAIAFQKTSSAHGTVYHARAAHNGSSWGTWYPFIDSYNIGSYNAGSATKLQTARTIWGQSFNGTANVSGNMTGVGSISASGNITAPSFYASNWFRSTGQTGWYSETYGGGWYMTDTTWLRAYNNKSIYTSSVMQADGIMRAGGGFETSSQDILRFTNYTHKNVIDWYWTSTEGDTVRFRIPGNNGQGIWMRLSAGNPYGLYISGALNVTNGIYSNTYVSALGQNSSDARLKTNIRDFKATALIKQLHPKSFEWNDLAKSKFEVFRNTGTQYGLIAQDVKEVMPEWVDDNLIGSGYMGIRYDKLIPVLLQGEIETISRVETLEDKVRRLEKENGKLKKKVKELERRAA